MNYEEFRKTLTVEEQLDWKELATFVPNKTLPIYNWFYYKEGFAKQMVEKLIEMFGVQQGDTVLDPFCGSGTTLLACKQNGINAVGLDVLPTAIFASTVKSKSYDPEKLREEAKVLFRRRFQKMGWEFPKIMRAMINKYALEDISFFANTIDGLEDKDFFTLALLNASIKVSYAWKDGGVIKIKRHPVPPLRKLFQRVVYKMIKEVEEDKSLSGKVSIFQCDARTMTVDDETIDAVITSPPYLNNIDYTKLYAIEDYFMEMRHVPSLRSFMGLRDSEEKKDAYFEDMKAVLSEMHRVLKKGGHAGIILGNAWLGEEIESDFLTAWMAKEIGFHVEKIVVLNKRFALENRTEKKGILRESLILLSKK